MESTTLFLKKLASILKLDANEFIEAEKHTTLKPIWDLWRSVTQDFLELPHLQLLLMRHTPEGLKIIYKMNWFSVQICSVTKSGGKTNNEEIRALIHNGTPLVTFGSINRKNVPCGN